MGSHLRVRAICERHSLLRAALLAAAVAALGAPLCSATINITASMVGSGPYYLNVQGETYVLTENISTTGTALVFAANNVTLNLNNRRVTFGTASARYRYGIAVPPGYASTSPMWSQSDITLWRSCDNAHIRDGEVVQGGSGPNCAAVVACEQSDLTLEHTNITIQGDDTFAVLTYDITGIQIFGNTITDNTDVVSDRHAGRAAIDIKGARDGAIEIYDNVIHNCRQWGVRIFRRSPATVWGHIRDNEIYANTIVANGYGLGIHGARIEAYGNIIHATNGRGIHIDMDGDYARVHDNDIDVTEQPFWDEYPSASAHGIKLEYCTDADIYNNYVVSKGIHQVEDAISNGSALNCSLNSGSNNRVHDNTFVARHLGGQRFNPADNQQFATAIEIMGVAAGSGLCIEDNSFITEDRFFTSNVWHGSQWPEPVDVSDLVIRGNEWARQQTSTPTRKLDIYFYNASVENLHFVDNVGGDFRDYGLGWPYYSCAWDTNYSGSVFTLEGNGDPVPNTPVRVYDGDGSLVTTLTSNSSGEAPYLAEDYSVFVQGSGSGHVCRIESCNPYQFTALYPDPVSEDAEIDQADWSVQLLTEHDTAVPDDIAARLSLSAPSLLTAAGGAIAFSLPAAGDVRLEVIGVSGRVIAVLQEGTMSAGDHSIDWRPNGQSAGVYFMRLGWNDVNRVQRLLLVN